MRKLEVETTSDCNLTCYNCNRATRQAPSKEAVSVEQIERLIGESLELGWPWDRIGLSGGEPTLHPEILKIVECLGRYRSYNPACTVTVVTNGFGDKVQSVLSRLPAWVRIRNSGKLSIAQDFESYNVAPIDLAEYRNEDFTRGCHLAELCGMGFTRHGFYACGPGASVDRVFDFDIGLKSLSLVTNRSLRQQLGRVCRYCGHYKQNHGAPTTREQVISASWERALEHYRQHKPVLSLY